MCSFPKLDDSCHYFIWLIILTSDECITVFAEQSGKTMEKYGNMWKKNVEKEHMSQTFRPFGEWIFFFFTARSNLL